MGSWKQDAQKVVWNVFQDISGKKDQAISQFESLVGGAKSQIQGVLNGSTVVGINVNQIDNMRNAIRDYVTGIETHLNTVRTNADTSQAFKGDYATGVTEYVAAVCEACKCVTSELLAFSDKLVDVKEAYQAKDTDLKSSIASSASEVTGGFKRYEERR